MIHNTIITALKKRRSIRKYKDTPISEEDLSAILDSGIWAPSGLNNQPWRFVIIKDSSIKSSIATLTNYGTIIKNASCAIAVFYHRPSGYNRDKDILSIGACIQNMLLAADSLGIGSVWLGEILNKKDAVNQILAVPQDNELMALISLGYPDETPESTRRALNTFILKRC